MNIETIRNYCLSKKGATEEFPFDEFTLVYKIGNKMFALSSLTGELSINLKCDPELALELRERYPSVQPGYHLQRPAAEAVVRAHRALRAQGFGLLVHDGYRPWYVTKMFWDGTPEADHTFVADPSQGSRHNRGCAVDLTL
jgi:predicted DNA-binding protein (MmcQ/YjbR family)